MILSRHHKATDLDSSARPALKRTVEIADPPRHIGAELWHSVDAHWTGQLFADESGGDPVATIGREASAGEAADGIKAIYRMLRTEHETA